MDYLTEIFSSNSEQARFITVLVSATVAVLIVLLNQWFARKKDRREFLVGKIEELFDASVDYQEKCRALMHEVERQHEMRQREPIVQAPSRDDMEAVNLSIAKIEMICSLYFPKQDYCFKKLSLYNYEIINLAHQGKLIHLKNAQANSWSHFWVCHEYLDSLCKSLVKKHGH